MSDRKYWGEFCALERYVFLLDDKVPCVRTVVDSNGSFNDHYQMSNLVDAMQEEINRLQSDNSALTERLKIKAI